MHSLKMLVNSAISAVLALTLVPAGAADEPRQEAVDLSQFDATISAKQREHWAFQPITRPAVPTLPRRSDTATSPHEPLNPIDAFLQSRLAERGWSPAAPAEPVHLLRRYYLDVIGLPPSIDEQQRFLNDVAARGDTAAITALVDELLSRPAYGERWARHWLDVARYAETNGYERDAAKPKVWRYRDYVIRSLNDDKSFNRFVVEQIAGDEIPDADRDSWIATGFHRLGHWDDEPADPKEDRFDQLDDIVSTTAQAFLGLTIGCARCHNHKFEPLTMLDYYRMVAIFNGLERPQAGRLELDLPAGTRDEISALAERDRRITAINKQIGELRGAARKLFLDSGAARLPADVVVAFWTDPSKRSAQQKQAVLQHSKQLDDESAQAIPESLREPIAALERQINLLRDETADLPRGYFMNETRAATPPTHLLVRGKATRPGPEIAPGVPAVLVHSQPAFLPPGSQTSQRRLTLAQWVADVNNPLTARVIVNRVWHHHFGEGIVRTPNDFGLAGAAPSHPELLDWLAHWFMHDAGWSLKQLHRLILTSDAYRMNKLGSAEYADSDPENELLWRQNYRRLEVEAIRDSMLAASGQLNRKMYGPSMLPAVPKEALDGNSDPDKIWKASDEHEAARRTIYAFIKRSMVVPMLEVLDLCDSTRSAARRQVTTVAPQALSLFNGEFVNRQAHEFAARVVLEAGNDYAAQIERAYRLALCRSATAAEQSAMQTFLANEVDAQFVAGVDLRDPRTLQNARLAALEQCCRAIFNLNEFMYSD